MNFQVRLKRGLRTSERETGRRRVRKGERHFRREFVREKFLGGVERGRRKFPRRRANEFPNERKIFDEFTVQWVVFYNGGERHGLEGKQRRQKGGKVERITFKVQSGFDRERTRNEKVIRDINRSTNFLCNVETRNKQLF